MAPDLHPLGRPPVHQPLRMLPVAAAFASRITARRLRSKQRQRPRALSIPRPHYCSAMRANLRRRDRA